MSEYKEGLLVNSVYAKKNPGAVLKQSFCAGTRNSAMKARIMKKRKIALLFGSLSDLKSGQCKSGFEVLRQEVSRGTIEIVGVFIGSIHRNTEWVLCLLQELSTLGVDVLIAGAGWANHLTGTSDAYLRYTIGDTRMVVIGVAFEDAEKPERSQAAVWSIVHVPGTQVVFDAYCGAEGAERACRFAATGTLPTIKRPEPRKCERFTFEDALPLAVAV